MNLTLTLQIVPIVSKCHLMIRQKPIQSKSPQIQEPPKFRFRPQSLPVRFQTHSFSGHRRSIGTQPLSQLFRDLKRHGHFSLILSYSDRAGPHLTLKL